MARNSDLPPWQEDHRTSEEINREVYLERAREYEELAHAANGANGGGETLADVATVAGAEEKPTPLMRPLPGAEPFPVNALPGTIKAAVMAVFAWTKAPLAICANSVLGAINLGAQAIADVFLPTGQVKPLSLYLLTVALSGDRKTSADDRSMIPIFDRQTAMRLEYQEQIKAYVNEHDAYEEERRKILRKKALGYQERKAQLNELAKDEPQKIRRPLLTVGEPTIEGLQRELVESHPSVGVFTSEGGAFFGGHGFSEEAKLRNYAGYSKLWDGGTVDRTRAKDGYQSIDNRRVAMHVQIQPDAATVFFSDPTAIDQGIVARILPVAPDTLQGTRTWEEVSDGHRRAMGAFHAQLSKLINRELNIKAGTLNELELPPLSLTGDARTHWIAYYNQIEARLAAKGDLAPIRWFASKMPEHVCRLAGTLRIYQDPDAKMIDLSELKCAITLVEHYAREHLRLHGAAKVNTKVMAAEKLLRWLVNEHCPKHGQDVPLADIMQRGPPSSRTADAARELMGILERHGWVKKLQAWAPVNGAKRKDAYAVKKVSFSEGPC